MQRRRFWLSGSRMRMMIKVNQVCLILAGRLISITALLSLFFPLLNLTGVAWADPIRIRFSHVVSPHTPKGQAVAIFARLANERLQGRVDIQVFPNSQLYNDDSILEALDTGGVEMAAPSTSKFSTWFPEFQLFDLPFLFMNKEVFYKAMAGNVGDRIYEILNKKGLHGLSVWENGFKQISNNYRALRRPADVSGITFRIMPSQVLEYQYEAIGGKSRVIPFSAVFTSLEQGVIGGQENTWSNIYSKGFHRVQKFITETNHGFLGYLVVTNQKFWQSLPDDIRHELESILGEATVWIKENSLKMNQQDKVKIIQSGLTNVTQLTEGDLKIWRDAFKPVHDRFRSVIGNDLIDYVYNLNDN